MKYLSRFVPSSRSPLSARKPRWFRAQRLCLCCSYLCLKTHARPANTRDLQDAQSRSRGPWDLVAGLTVAPGGSRCYLEPMPAALGSASRPCRTLPKTRVWASEHPDPPNAPGEPPVLAAFRIWPGAGVTTTTRRAVPDYLRARYYDPSTGQFVSRDPLVAKTRQPYAYAGDNPLNAVDPTGLDCGIFNPGDCVSQAQRWANDNLDQIAQQSATIAAYAGVATAVCTIAMAAGAVTELLCAVPLAVTLLASETATLADAKLASEGRASWSVVALDGVGFGLSMAGAGVPTGGTSPSGWDDGAGKSLVDNCAALVTIGAKVASAIDHATTGH